MSNPREASRPLSEAVEEPNRSIAKKLERALEVTEPSEKDRLIRDALQQPAIEWGEVDADV